MMDPTRPAALLSVHDRRGVVELARALEARGMRLYATGGTRAHLAERGVEALDVEALTGYPPLFEGRVKTLHPAIFGGILADRGKAAHVEQARAHGVPEIAVVVVNLYPFEATVARAGTTVAEAIEQIDVGGVALLRAAAKNHAHATVVVDPDDYPALIAGPPDAAARRRLAARAFARTAEYDAAIARYLEADAEADRLPGSLTLRLPLAQALRYGENPQSAAAFYLGRDEELPEQLHGKALSYNNLLDLDATLRLLVRSPLEAAGVEPAAHAARAAIVKHTIPCGVAEAARVEDAVAEALACDPVSAYGGVVAVDAPVDLAAAERLAAFFLEIVAAPDFSPEALERLRRKKNLRVLRFRPELPERLRSELRVRTALRGILAEDDDPQAAPETWRVATERPPTPAEWIDLTLAWDVVRHVKSNGIVVVKDRAARGICAGQTNRVSAVEIAAARAGGFARGAACASDGFFPFADGLEAAARRGCTAIVAPSGSIRDGEVVASADRLGVSLVFSSRRYFLH